MSKFKEYFKEPQYFTHGVYVVDGELSATEAARLFSIETGDDITTDMITEERVRYGFAPENVEDMAGEACWYTGAGNGKGTKPVWMLGGRP